MRLLCLEFYVFFFSRFRMTKGDCQTKIQEIVQAIVREFLKPEENNLIPQSD